MFEQVDTDTPTKPESGNHSPKGTFVQNPSLIRDLRSYNSAWHRSIALFWENYPEEKDTLKKLFCEKLNIKNAVVLHNDDNRIGFKAYEKFEDFYLLIIEMSDHSDYPKYMHQSAFNKESAWAGMSIEIDIFLPPSLTHLLAQAVQFLHSTSETDESREIIGLAHSMCQTLETQKNMTFTEMNLLMDLLRNIPRDQCGNSIDDLEKLYKTITLIYQQRQGPKILSAYTTLGLYFPLSNEPRHAYESDINTTGDDVLLNSNAFHNSPYAINIGELTNDDSRDEAADQDWLEFVPKMIAYNWFHNNIEDGSPLASYPEMLQSLGYVIPQGLNINLKYANSLNPKDYTSVVRLLYPSPPTAEEYAPIALADLMELRAEYPWTTL